MIETLTIYGGLNKKNYPEKIKKIILNNGDIVGIVGPTGSGKSALIEDIEQIAQCDTPTKRQILINNKVPSYDDRTNPKKKIIAQLSQNMNFLADMSVEEFLKLHAKCRGKSIKCINQVIDCANTLTGEAINKNAELTILSGGQSRALMVADVALISNSPIVLVDEIENAGIKKHEALQLLSGAGKIILVVTHDPVLALMTAKRIVMKNGGMQRIINTSVKEMSISKELSSVDKKMLLLREKVRDGDIIENTGFVLEYAT